MDSALVVLKWADDEYPFILKLKQIEELQRKCGVGLGEIVQRVFTGRPWVGDIYHTIFLGLVGGGMSPVRAKELVTTYIDGEVLARPNDPSSPLATAQAILQAAYFGMDQPEEDEDEGNVEAATTDESTLRPSEEST